MRATNKIMLQMGLLTAPDINMGSAIESSEKVSFNQLHGECQHRVVQKLVCPECECHPIKDENGKVVGHEDITIVDKKAEIVKGYPLTKSSWVVLTEEEIESCKKESTDVVKVIQFVEDGDIPEIYHESASYLWAGKEGLETFSLFHQLLSECGKVALAKMISRGKDHFLALKPYGQVIVAYELYFPNQIRGTGEIEKPLESGFDQETIDMAKALVTKMTKPFKPEEIKDEYTDGLKKIIETKASGNVVPLPVATKKEKKIVSLKDALRGSLAVNE